MLHTRKRSCWNSDRPQTFKVTKPHIHTCTKQVLNTHILPLTHLTHTHQALIIACSSCRKLDWINKEWHCGSWGFLIDGNLILNVISFIAWNKENFVEHYIGCIIMHSDWSIRSSRLYMWSVLNNVEAVWTNVLRKDGEWHQGNDENNLTYWTV